MQVGGGGDGRVFDGLLARVLARDFAGPVSQGFTGFVFYSGEFKTLGPSWVPGRRILAVLGILKLPSRFFDTFFGKYVVS